MDFDAPSAENARRRTHRETQPVAAREILSHRVTLALAVAVSLLPACAPGHRHPNIAAIYERAAQVSDAERNPVIVIPGILGSRLIEESTGTIVWGAFTGEFADPGTAAGAQRVALPMKPGAPLRELRDDVAAAGVLDRLKLDLVGIPVELNAYRNILAVLGAANYRDQQLAKAGEGVNYGDQHFTCFQFAYDWRRDNVENAHRLLEFIKEKKVEVEAELLRRYGVRRDVKFDIVAHSMGGLVTRYCLKYGSTDLPESGPPPTPTWEGAQYVNRAIIVATPSSGSILSLENLIRGKVFASFLPKYSDELLGTMPSVYQLAPRPRHNVLKDATGAVLDFYDPAVWERFGWGLAKGDDVELQKLLPDVATAEERRSVARNHLKKCLNRARSFADAMDLPATRPESLDLVLYAGDALDTPATAVVDERGEFRIVGYAPGDGTVLRSSALMDERVGADWSPRVKSPIPWSRVQFLFDDHIGLTASAEFADNLLYQLLESPSRQ